MKEMHKRIIEKAMELCRIADRDEMLYGDSYVEIGERSISVLDATKIEVNHKKDGTILYGKSPIKPKDAKCVEGEQ